MKKILIYIGEGVKFDLNNISEALKAMSGLNNFKRDGVIGAIAEFNFDDRGLIVRISEDCETITVDGPISNSADFVLHLQERLSVNLRVIDMDYSFDLEVKKFSSAKELLNAMESA